MHRPVSLALLGLVLLAGCNTLPAGSGPPEPTRTVTPVPVPEGAAPTPVATRPPPPGVLPDGSVNVTRLVHVTNAELANRSYTLERSLVVYNSKTGRWTPVKDRSVQAFFVNGTAKLLRFRNAVTNETETWYFEPNRTYVRVAGTRSVETDYIPQSGDTVWRGIPSGVLWLGYQPAVLPADEVAVARVEWAGRPFYRVQVAANPRGSNVWQQRDYRATLYVTPDGLIRSLYVAFEYRREGQEAYRKRRVRLQIRDVGETTVPEPAWVTELKRASDADGDLGTADAGTATRTPATNATQN